VFSNVDAKSFAASPTVEEPAAMRLYWLIVLFLLATVVAGAKVTHRVHVFVHWRALSEKERKERARESKIERERERESARERACV